MFEPQYERKPQFNIPRGILKASIYWHCSLIQTAFSQPAFFFSKLSELPIGEQVQDYFSNYNIYSIRYEGEHRSRALLYGTPVFFNFFQDGELYLTTALQMLLEKKSGSDGTLPSLNFKQWTPVV